MKLSIIIPVYNVEQYIEKCLKSCLEQDIPQSEYEIIVVNDGSPDGSLAIAERIAATATNVTVISQKNGGLSAARNTGLQAAKGEFVWFVDSDDWIEKNCLKDLISSFENNDVIKIGHSLVYTDKTVTYIPKAVSNGKELIKRDFLRPAPFYIMRQSLLKSNSLSFTVGIYHEDTEFTPRMLYLCRKLAVYPKSLYYYLQRENSITTTVNPKRAFDLLKVAQSLFNFGKRVSDDCKPYFNDLVSRCINSSLAIISKSDKNKKQDWVKEIREHKHLLRAMRKSSKTKYKIQGTMFLCIPACCIIGLYKLMSIVK